MQKPGSSHRALQDVQGKCKSARCPRQSQTLGCSGLQAFTSGTMLTQTLFDFIFNNLSDSTCTKIGFRTRLQERTAGSTADIKCGSSIRCDVLEPQYRKGRHPALLVPSWYIYVYICQKKQKTITCSLLSSLCFCCCNSITIVRQIINIVGHCKVSKQGCNYQHSVQKDNISPVAKADESSLVVTAWISRLW